MPMPEFTDYVVYKERGFDTKVIAGFISGEDVDQFVARQRNHSRPALYQAVTREQAMEIEAENDERADRRKWADTVGGDCPNPNVKGPCNFLTEVCADCGRPNPKL